MKKAFTLAACFFALSVSFAQTTTRISAKEVQKLTAAKRCILSGEIRNMHNIAIKGVRAFIYLPDSSIIASGFTDADGYFQTNSVVPGTYTVKIMYPSHVATMVTDVRLKPGINAIKLKAEMPAEDNAIPYSDIAPKPITKKKKTA